jgi:hypothetical protein
MTNFGPSPDAALGDADAATGRLLAGVVAPVTAKAWIRAVAVALAPGRFTARLWRRVAESSRDARAHRHMLERADRLGCADTADEVSTEAWPVTRARLGL